MLYDLISYLRLRFYSTVQLCVDELCMLFESCLTLLVLLSPDPELACYSSAPGYLFVMLYQKQIG